MSINQFSISEISMAQISINLRLLTSPNIKTTPILALPQSSDNPAVLFESISNWFSLVEQNAAEYSPSRGLAN